MRCQSSRGTNETNQVWRHLLGGASKTINLGSGPMHQGLVDKGVVGEFSNFLSNRRRAERLCQCIGTVKRSLSSLRTHL